METTTFPMKDFLENENIPYLKMWYYLDETDGNKKKPIGEKNNISLEDVLKKKNSTCRKPTGRQQFKNENDKWETIPFTSENEKASLQQVFTIFLKYTEDLFCIDVDDSNIHSMDDFIKHSSCDILKKCCWVKGNTKGIHIYTRVTNMIEYTNQVDVFKTFKGDFIHSKNNMWEKIDKTINNYNGSISSLDYENIKEIFNDRLRKDLLKKKNTKPKTSANKSKFLVIEDDAEETKEQELLNLITINPSDRNAWLRICACIKYLGLSNDDWIKFGKSNNLNWDGEKQKLFDYVNTDKDLNDIYYLQQLAKKCNPEKYKEWLKKWNVYSITANEVNDPYEASQKICKTLKHTLRLCKETWYMLTDNQLWKTQKEPSFYIVKEMHKYLDPTRESLNTKISYSDGEEKKKYVEQLESWLKLYNFVSKIGYVTTITKYLKTLLVDDKFSEMLDCNKGKLAFKNGIMDLETKTFRKGIRWDDFITDTIPYDYKQVENCEFVKGVLKQILNNDETHLEYHLSVFGASFIGCPELLKTVFFHIDKTEGGRGDNGKSFWFDILHSLMPNYVYKSKSSFLDSKNQKVHKQISQLKGKRLFYLEEMPKKQDTNYTLFKEIGDGKNIENEVMFGTCENIIILCILHAISNHIPDIDAREEACYNRYRQISYNSHFDRTGTRKEIDPEKLEFIADPELSDTIKKNHYDEVFNLIIDYAHKFYINNKKLPEIPEQFKKDAKETKESNDKFGCWFRENMKKGEKLRTPLKLICYLSKYSEKDIKDEMKRMGFKYNKDLYEMGLDSRTGKSYRGGYEGVGVIDESPEEECYLLQKP